MTEPNLDLNTLTKSIRSFKGQNPSYSFKLVSNDSYMNSYAYEQPRLNTEIFLDKEMEQLAESVMHISNAIDQWHIELKRVLSTNGK